jgi:hypothetical protein
MRRRRWWFRFWLVGSGALRFCWWDAFGGSGVLVCFRGYGGADGAAAVLRVLFHLALRSFRDQ